MEFRTLQAFVEVVRRGGFSKAAAALFATQSTVSKAVRQLEAELGAPLLQRIGHRSVLTATGEVVYRRGLRLLTDRDDLLAEIEEIRGLRQGTLRLGLPAIGSSNLFARAFTLYRQRYPGIDVRLVEHGSDQLEKILRAGEIDLAVSLVPVAGDFESQRVHCEPLVAAAAAAHPAARKDTITLRALGEFPFLLFETGFTLNRIILDCCARQGFEPVVVARSSQIDFLLELAAAGLGIAFLPRMVAEQRDKAGVRLVRLADPDMVWDIAITWRRGAYLSHAARAWLDVVRELYPAPPGSGPEDS